MVLGVQRGTRVRGLTRPPRPHDPRSLPLPIFSMAIHAVQRMPACSAWCEEANSVAGRWRGHRFREGVGARWCWPSFILFQFGARPILNRFAQPLPAAHSPRLCRTTYHSTPANCPCAATRNATQQQGRCDAVCVTVGESCALGDGGPVFLRSMQRCAAHCVSDIGVRTMSAAHCGNGLQNTVPKLTHFQHPVFCTARPLSLRAKILHASHYTTAASDDRTPPTARGNRVRRTLKTIPSCPPPMPPCSAAPHPLSSAPDAWHHTPLIVARGASQQPPPCHAAAPASTSGSATLVAALALPDSRSSSARAPRSLRVCESAPHELRAEKTRATRRAAILLPTLTSCAPLPRSARARPGPPRSARWALPRPSPRAG